MTSSLLNEIKIELRSLLISSPQGLSEDELCRDYSLFNSQRLLPYEIFGYSTRKDFLNSLTDILYRSSDNSLHPIVDQSTAHIFKFVQQQRKNKKKKQKKSQQIPNLYSKLSIPRRKQRKTTPSSFQHMHPTVGAIKVVENKEALPTIGESSSKFERINVTNEFLQHLLIHFREQQRH